MPTAEGEVMTDEQIRERCVESGDDITREIVHTGETSELESLYREAMAKGLEMEKIQTETWCRQEAERLNT
jgi:uncharacterized glyoxalase superfamily protein PhnB